MVRKWRIYDYLFCCDLGGLMDKESKKKKQEAEEPQDATVFIETVNGGGAVAHD